MKTNESKEKTPYAAMVERLGNSLAGNMGLGANFHSLIKKRSRLRTPKTMRLMTVSEDQARTTFPKSRARRIMRALPIVRRDPDQSRALSPVMVGVLGGDERGRKKRMVRNTSRPMGILIQKHYLQLSLVLKTPPITGPIALPNAHTPLVTARYNPLSLKLNES